MADFMHGPRVKIGNRSQKAILCAILDAHSRMCVGFGFNSSETVNVFTRVLQEAFETYGICLRLYADNGSAFISEFLSRICALAGVSLIHSKPYDSSSRGNGKLWIMESWHVSPFEKHIFLVLFLIISTISF